MTVYHNPYGIGNILSLNSTKAKHRVTYDSWDHDGVFKVHTKDGIVEFKPSEKGLHYHDTSEDGSNFECMLVNTVRDNFEGHTKHDIAKAKEARKLQGMIGNPTDKEFKGMVCENLSPIAPSLCKTLRMLTVSLVLISLTLGGKRLEQSRSMSA